jgi:hypothetical protein
MRICGATKPVPSGTGQAHVIVDRTLSLLYRIHSVLKTSPNELVPAAECNNSRIRGES